MLSRFARRNLPQTTRRTGHHFRYRTALMLKHAPTGMGEGDRISVAYVDPDVHLMAMVQAPWRSTHTEVLSGVVERVTFHNAENGCCVLRVKACGQRDLITVLGHAAIISAGEFVATFRYETIS